LGIIPIETDWHSASNSLRKPHKLNRATNTARGSGRHLGSLSEI
jgi:hypothetical protein